MRARPLAKLLLLFLLFMFLLNSCKGEEGKEGERSLSPSRTDISYRILFVDSYSWDYQWSRRVREGLFTALNLDYDEKGLPLDTSGSFHLKVVEMDTKTNPSEEYKIQAGHRTKDIIDSWKPDLVICSDDNAVKYIIQPYFIGSSLPFLFCGVNSDASEYGLPAENVTGILEIHNAVGLVNMLHEYTDGDRIVFLSGNNLSGRKIGASVQEQLGGDVRLVFVDSYQEWKEQYEVLQNEADLLLLETAEYFPDWDGNRKALEWFVSQVTRIPTGAWDDSLKAIALITLERMGGEQGEWVGKTALEILRGELSPGEIPLVKGKRAAVYLNLKLARDMGILFPPDLIDMAHLTNKIYSLRKVLYVNSYHEGYVWSDELEMGLLKALSRSDLLIDLKILRMDTKRNSAEEEIKEQALYIKDYIEEWDPDVVIGSDDDFVRYVLVPYFREGEIPFVFCGVNCDASPYELENRNITGMVEVDPVNETVELLSLLTEGRRIGFLGSDLYYAWRIVDFSARDLGKDFDLVLMVDNMESWKSAYLRMQKEVDMLLLSSPSGLSDFNEDELLDFVQEHGVIPSGNMLDGEIAYAHLGVTKVAEEQGWWAGNAALEILDGRSAGDIPFTQNSQTKILLNMTLAGNLEVPIPLDLVQSSILYTDANRK
jgi:ABC-type uncharacterized transport system substrate-binding protein